MTHKMKPGSLLKIISAILILVILFTGCRKDDYYMDTGVHKARYDGSILQYLKSKPDYFDTLVKVISLAGMEDVFEDSVITFFAPPQQCILRSVHALNRYLYFTGKDTVIRLGQINKEVWKDLLSLYILPDRYQLKDFPQIDTTLLQTFPGQGYISWKGRPMNVGVIYNDAGGVKYAGYRQLCYSYITDPTSEDYGGMINVVVASSDIQPGNGVVHVLRLRRHAFGFSATNFILKAIGKGISPPDK